MEEEEEVCVEGEEVTRPGGSEDHREGDASIEEQIEEEQFDDSDAQDR